MLHSSERLGTTDQDVSHVAYVKDADRGTDSHMFGDEAGVLDRHVPPAKIDHLRTHLAMDPIQSGLAECGRSLGYWSQ